MILHDATFENLAKAPVKTTDVIVAKQVLTGTGYVDGTEIWSSSDILMQVKIDVVGEMFGTITKKAVVDLLGIVNDVKSGDIFRIRLGIKDPSNSTFNYVSQGYFVVDSIDYNYDAGSTSVTMYDHMWAASHSLYKDTAVGSLITYPATVETLAAYVASLLSVDLSADFGDLPNAQFEVVQDLYTPISNATLQNVIQDIAGATGTTARIHDTTLEFSQYEVRDENLDSSTLKTLKIGDTYGPVTSVVLGRVPQNDNIAIYSVPPFTNTATANATTNLLTIVGHNMVNGNMIRLVSTGTLPTPLQADKNYYVYTTNPDTFRLAPTYADAIAGTNLIDLTSAGTGTITIPTLSTKEIQINNNQILDNDRQILLPALYNTLSGIDWSDVKTETVGLGWHEGGDVIQFTQGAKTVRAFITEIHLVLAGSIKETMLSKIPDVAAIDYQAAGGILKTLYNTEIKVNKQDNAITSVVSRQDSLDNQISENFTSIVQDVDDILLTISKTGGGNQLLNSVGYAKEQATDADAVSYGKLISWDYPVGYKVGTNGAVTSYDSSESQNYGGTSGHVIQMSSDYLTNKSVSLTQRVNVAVNVPLSFALRINNALGKGDVTITLTNDNDTFTIVIDDIRAYVWEEVMLENFMSTMSWLDITITSGSDKFMFTDLRLLYGSTLQGWMQASAEILSARVQFTDEGMRVFDDEHNLETRVTYNEFSTRRRSDGVKLFEADDSGIITNDLTIQGSTTYERDGTAVIKQITIPASNARGGIAFIKVT